MDFLKLLLLLHWPVLYLHLEGNQTKVLTGTSCNVMSVCIVYGLCEGA